MLQYQNKDIPFYMGYFATRNQLNCSSLLDSKIKFNKNKKFLINNSQLRKTSIQNRILQQQNKSPTHCDLNFPLKKRSSFINSFRQKSQSKISNNSLNSTILFQDFKSIRSKQSIPTYRYRSSDRFLESLENAAITQKSIKYIKQADQQNQLAVLKRNKKKKNRYQKNKVKLIRNKLYNNLFQNLQKIFDRKFKLQSYNNLKLKSSQKRQQVIKSIIKRFYLQKIMLKFYQKNMLQKKKFFLTWKDNDCYYKIKQQNQKQILQKLIQIEFMFIFHKKSLRQKLQKAYNLIKIHQFNRNFVERFFQRQLQIKRMDKKIALLRLLALKN